MNVIRFSDLIAAGKVAGQRVFIRADLNVPQDDNGKITEDTRIRASLPAIKMALDAGAAVMVTSHLGRPTEGEFKPEDSLAPVAARMAELLGRPVPLQRDWVDAVSVAPGQLVLLENCRINKGEKKCDDALSRKLAALCDIFVHDAFGTAHRAEATTYGIANTFMLASGLKIGKSLAEPDLVDQAKAVMAAMAARGAEVPIPEDVVTAKTFAAGATASVKAAADVADDDLILDIGPKTAAKLAAKLMAAGTIVWNGPVGVFEFEAFSHGTEAIARAIAASDAFSIAGGGDTLAAIAKYGIDKDIGYISTGGGAFLEVLEGKTLPAFEILQQRAAG